MRRRDPFAAQRQRRLAADPDANPAAWLAWHQANERMYEAVSDVDRFGHHEALYWANFSRRQALGIAARIQGSTEGGA